MSLPFAPRLLFSYLALLLHVQASSWLELIPSQQMIIVTPVLFLFGIHCAPCCSVGDVFMLSNRHVTHTDIKAMHTHTHTHTTHTQHTHTQHTHTQHTHTTHTHNTHTHTTHTTHTHNTQGHTQAHNGSGNTH